MGTILFRCPTKISSAAANGDQQAGLPPGYQPACWSPFSAAEDIFVGHRNSIVQACHQGTSLPVGHHFQQHKLVSRIPKHILDYKHEGGSSTMRPFHCTSL